MENPIRGEGKICINGEDHKLCLTLGALAQLEEALGGGDYSQLQQRLKKPRVNDIILILHALLMGGGSLLTLEALKASNINLESAAAAIATAFALTEVDNE